MESQTSHKGFQSGEHRENLILQVLAEKICLNTEILHANLIIFTWKLECNVMFSFMEEIFDMIDFRIAKKEQI